MNTVGNNDIGLYEVTSYDYLTCSFTVDSSIVSSITRVVVSYVGCRSFIRGIKVVLVPLPCGTLACIFLSLENFSSCSTQKKLIFNGGSCKIVIKDLCVISFVFVKNWGANVLVFQCFFYYDSISLFDGSVFSWIQTDVLVWVL